MITEILVNKAFFVSLFVLSAMLLALWLETRHPKK